MSKYNPNIHMYVVRNLRTLYKRAEMDKHELILSDEEIWDSFEESYMPTFSDEDKKLKEYSDLIDEFGEQDAMHIVFLRDNNNKKRKLVDHMEGRI